MVIPDRMLSNDIYTVKQIAEYLQISELTVRRALNAGDLIGMKFGNTWRIESKQVHEWLRKKITKQEGGANNDFC